MTIQELLDETIKAGASDLHLLVGIAPAIRVDGELSFLTNHQPIKREDIESLIYSIVTPEQKELLLANRELDFSLGFGGGAYGDRGRFRVNAYYQRGYLSADFRYLQPNIRSLDDLKMPKIAHKLTELKQGFILVTGPTGHGKSTTLAAMINEINMGRATHIITIEDPIEYVYGQGKSIISQRELGTDTHSWGNALKSALREDPDVVLIGEMRDPDTMAAALTIAETGHLVFATLHTNSAAQSIDRIVDSFQSAQQGQIRIQLSAVLKGIISQRLLPKIGGGRVPAVEVLLGTPGVASNIREAKTHLIDSIIQTSQDAGMIPFEASLAQLVLSGAITLDDAKSYARSEQELLRLVG